MRECSGRLGLLQRLLRKKKKKKRKGKESVLAESDSLGVSESDGVCRFSGRSVGGFLIVAAFIIIFFFT